MLTRCPLEKIPAIGYHNPIVVVVYLSRVPCMYFDIACLVVVGVSALSGLMKGFLSQVVSVVVLCIAAVSAWYFARPFAVYFHLLLQRTFSQFVFDEALVIGVTGVGIFIVLSFLLGVVGHSIRGRMTTLLALQMWDRILGMCLGAAKGAAIVLVVIGLLRAAHPAVSRVTSTVGYASYYESVQESGAYAMGSFVWDEMYVQWPVISSMFTRITASLGETEPPPEME